MANIKIFFALIIYCVFVNIIYGQPYENEKQELINFLIENCMLKDHNPIYEKDNNKINNIFSEVIRNKSNYTLIEKENKRREVFEILNENLWFSYEDSSEVYRTNKRRILCYMILSMLLPEKTENNHFINIAKLCVNDFDECCRNKEKTLIDLLDILLLFDRGNM